MRAGFPQNPIDIHWNLHTCSEGIQTLATYKFLWKCNNTLSSGTRVWTWCSDVLSTTLSSLQLQCILQGQTILSSSRRTFSTSFNYKHTFSLTCYPHHWYYIKRPILLIVSSIILRLLCTVIFRLIYINIGRILKR